MLNFIVDKQQYIAILKKVLYLEALLYGMNFSF